MAERPVFLATLRRPYSVQWNAVFTYNSGLSPVQKKKNIIAIHEAFARSFPGRKVLEISSKSMQLGGIELSAFSMKKFVPSIGKAVAVENVYQAGKVFLNGGPYSDLLEVSPREAKRDPRLKNSGPLMNFCFEGRSIPPLPVNAFYDFIYINALLEKQNRDLAELLLQYDAFTDIEFAPGKSLNCQARAAANFVSLARAGMIEEAKDFDRFRALFV